jgi:hypothetical protein
MIGIIAGVEKDYAFIIYSVLMIPVLLVYPNNDNRYIFPILPFFVYFSFQGMRTGFMGLRDGYHKAGQAIMYIFWIGVLLFFANALVNLGRANLASDRQIVGPFDAPSTEMFNFIKNTTPPDSVIVFFKPRAMRLFTDRNSIMITKCPQLTRGDYVVVYTKGSNLQILPADIGSCGPNLQPVFENTNFIAYKIAH